MKLLEIKIASFCELFQNRFYFKDVRRNLSGNFWLCGIVDMKNNYHQIFVAIRLMTYIHVKLTLFTCCLFRLYKKNIKKRVRDKRQKRQKSFDFF